MRDVPTGLPRTVQPEGNAAKRFWAVYTLYPVAPTTASHERTMSGLASVTVRFAGPVSGQIAVKDHGFGTVPATSGRPCRSFPATVSVVFPGAHVYVRGTTGLIDQLTVAMFIAWLNVTTMSAFRATPVALFAGTVEAMYGFAHTVVKDQGFGTGPATSGSPTLSLPAVICAV